MRSDRSIAHALRIEGDFGNPDIAKSGKLAVSSTLDAGYRDVGWIATVAADRSLELGFDGAVAFVGKQRRRRQPALSRSGHALEHRLRMPAEPTGWS